MIKTVELHFYYKAGIDCYICMPEILGMFKRHIIPFSLEKTCDQIPFEIAFRTSRKVNKSY